jgi:hypothetical protein
MQSAVDSKNKLIVAHEVVNEVNDYQQLSGMAREAKEILGVEKIEVVADKGYYSNTEVRQCVDNGITPYMEKADTSANTKLGLYGKSKFSFDPVKDVYHCPGEKEPDYRFSTWEKERELRYYRASDCKTCALKALHEEPVQPHDHARGERRLDGSDGAESEAEPGNDEAQEGAGGTSLRDDQARDGDDLLFVQRPGCGAGRDEFDRAGLQLKTRLEPRELRGPDESRGGAELETRRRAFLPNHPADNSPESCSYPP